MNTDNTSPVLQEADKDEEIKVLKEALAEKSEEIKRLRATFIAGTITILERQLAQLKKKVFEWRWIDAEKELPERNVGVLVFIPGEDDHITSGMYDVSGYWVLLDEYRKPDADAPVTRWMKMPPKPSK